MDEDEVIFEDPYEEAFWDQDSDPEEERVENDQYRDFYV